MPPFLCWADLPLDLLCHIGDSLDLKCYGSARGTCTAWRSGLAPPSPSILVVHEDARCCLSALSLPTHRCFYLKAIPWGARCVGSSNGWIALYGGQSTFSLFNPITSTKIVLPLLTYRSGWVSKLIFTPNPTTDDFTAAAICYEDMFAYVTAGSRRWAILGPIRLAQGDQLADLIYHEKGGKERVYCLTRYGNVHVLCLPERRKPIMVDDPSSPPAILPSPLSLSEQHDVILRRSFGPDPNVPATVGPLLSLPFDPATSFVPPYNRVSVFTSAKNLVFCQGHLYQIWRNVSCTVTVKVPGGGHRRVAENEVFVLRYYAQRQPCWDVVTDLGGYSVFLGRNNAVSMYAEGGIPGLKGNCVYWIGGTGRDQGMVFDMATGKSTACLLPAAGGAPQSTICWYFLSDNN